MDGYKNIRSDQKLTAQNAQKTLGVGDKVKLPESSLLKQLTRGPMAALKGAAEPLSHRAANADRGDFTVSSNSAFRKPMVREDQSVAGTSNCVDDSNSLSVANVIGAPRPVIGNAEERSPAAPSAITGPWGKNRGLSFMEKA